MAAHPGLARIIVVPRNGYVNRLQAWASAALLGAELDVPVQVMWEPEPIAAAAPSLLFDDRLLRMSFIDEGELTELLGAPHASLARYLTRSPSGRALVLAGHDRGEQVFMDDVATRIHADDAPEALVLIAGGRFHLPGIPENGEAGFQTQRQRFYAHLAWSPLIAERVTAELQSRAPFLGLHVRGTDHSRSAPTPRMIRTALEELRTRTGITSLFVAADTADTRTVWHRTATGLGFEPWSTAVETFDRSSEMAGVAAMVDWQVLGRASASTYSALSTFGAEAAVASGHPERSIPLSASAGRQRLRAGAEAVGAAVSWPGRRWRSRQGRG